MDLQTFIINVYGFVNKVAVPLILGIAFLVFLVNVVRYFIIGGANEQSQENARSLALWGILAFVIILSFWGIVNMFVSGFGLEGQQVPDVDYIKAKG